MGRLLLAILAFAMVMAIIKMVLIALLIAGLIFRTKETIGFLLIAGMFHLISIHPIAGLSLLGVIILLAVANAMKSNKADSRSIAFDRGLDDPEQE